MGLILLAATFFITIFAIVFSISEGIKEKDKRILFESVLIFFLSILSFVFMLFYIFIAEAGPTEPPNTFFDYLTVGILCIAWTIGIYFGFLYLNGRLMKLSVLSQSAVAYLFVVIGMLGSINPKMIEIDEILIIRIICTGIITFAIIPMLIKTIKERKSIINIRKP